MFEIVENHPCPYLTDRVATTAYRLNEGVSEERYEAMLERGWRRFGRTFFRPECRGCAECRSLRIEVERFKPNRSMRRTLSANEDLEVTVGPASLSVEHLELYDRYHADMRDRRGWVERDSSPADYHQTFVEGRASWGHEMLIRLHGRLVCVALLDWLPAALSAVYCFYDPRLRHRSLGIYAVLQEIELARREEVPYLHLGYWIPGNASMRYKSKYRPHEILRGRPDLDEAAEWREPATPLAGR
ncbi:MAG: arginyltransferase [Acidobacteriota bacterium]